MKIGDYVYRVSYWIGSSGSRRHFENSKIKRMTPAFLFLGNGDRISRSVIGNIWFLSKKAAYKDALKKHMREYGKIYREINHLKRKSK